MVNKFEAYGIAFSIGAMALALFLIRLESTNDSFLTAQSGSQSSVIYIADSEDAQAGVSNAVREATNEQGAIEKLIIDDVLIGVGSEVSEGDTVEVHYIGTLQTGQQFDNSYVKGQPFTFTVGDGRVIAGWDEGIVGMRVGGQRILVIPSELAYGREGFGPIPGNATLVFAIELVSIDE